MSFVQVVVVVDGIRKQLEGSRDSSIPGEVCADSGNDKLQSLDSLGDTAAERATTEK